MRRAGATGRVPDLTAASLRGSHLAAYPASAAREGATLAACLCFDDCVPASEEEKDSERGRSFPETQTHGAYLKGQIMPFQPNCHCVDLELLCNQTIRRWRLDPPVD